MVNVTKKSAVVLLIFIFTVILNSCTYEQRVDFSELVRRMNRWAEGYEAVLEEAFFSDGEWFLFVSSGDNNEVLLNGREDESKLLTRVCVTILNDTENVDSELFFSVCENSLRAFTYNGDSEGLLSSSHLYDEGILFSDAVYFYESGRYKTSFFNSEIGSTFMIEIVR